MGSKTNTETTPIEPGETLYDDRGRPVGRVTGVTDDGFEAEVVEPGENDQEEIPGKKFGEGYLMWRCGECGEMGELDDGMPSRCPNCDAPKEELSEVLED